MFGDQAGLAPPPPAQPTPTPAASAGSTVAVALLYASAAANDLVKDDNPTSDAPTAAGNSGSKGTEAAESAADSSDPTPLVSPMRGAGAGAARKIKSSSGSRSPLDDDEGRELGGEEDGEDSDAVKKKISYEDNTDDAAKAPAAVAQEAPTLDQPATEAGAAGTAGAAPAAAPAAKKEDSVKPLKRGAAARGVVPRAAEEVLLAVALKRKLGIDAEVISMYTHTHKYVCIRA